MIDYIIEEMQNKFALRTGIGAYAMESLEEEYPAWLIRESREYGVCFPYDGEDVSESFANAIMESRSVTINEEPYNVLMFLCDDTEFRNEFSEILDKRI